VAQGVYGGLYHQIIMFGLELMLFYSIADKTASSLRESQQVEQEIVMLTLSPCWSTVVCMCVCVSV
jgi:hypothetical protein